MDYDRLDQKNREQLETANSIVEFYRTHGERPKRHKHPDQTDDEKTESKLGRWIHRNNTKYGLAQEFLDKELGEQWRGTKEVKLRCLKKEARVIKKAEIVNDTSDVIYYGSLSDSFRHRCPWFLSSTVQIPPIRFREKEPTLKKKKRKKSAEVKPEVKEQEEDEKPKPKKLKVRKTGVYLKEEQEQQEE
jgi:hypothetical protein